MLRLHQRLSPLQENFLQNLNTKRKKLVFSIQRFRPEKLNHHKLVPVAESKKKRSFQSEFMTARNVGLLVIEM